jgi:hypothetical protein
MIEIPVLHPAERLLISMISCRLDEERIASIASELIPHMILTSEDKTSKSEVDPGSPYPYPEILEVPYGYSEYSTEIISYRDEIRE